MINSFGLITQFSNNNHIQYYRISITNIDSDTIKNYKVPTNLILSFLAQHKGLKVVVIDKEFDVKDDKIISLPFWTIANLPQEHIFIIS